MNDIYDIAYKEFRELRHEYKSLVCSFAILALYAFIILYSINGIIPANLSYLIVIMYCAMGTLQNVVSYSFSTIYEEKKNKTFELLFSLKVSRIKLIFGKMIIPILISIVVPAFLLLLLESVALVMSKKALYSLFIQYSVWQCYSFSVLLGIMAMPIIFTMTLISRNSKVYGTVISLFLYVTLFYFTRPEQNVINLIIFVIGLIILFFIFLFICFIAINKLKIYEVK